MSIALESGRGLGGGPRFGRVGRCGFSASPPASAGRGSSSVGAGQRQPRGGGQVGVGRRGGNVAASGSSWSQGVRLSRNGWGFLAFSGRMQLNRLFLDRFWLGNVRRKEVCKFYNGKSGSFGRLPDTVIPSPPQKNLPKPETPSPRKRKGLLPFTFKWGKLQHKEEVFPEDIVDSPTNCRRMTLSSVASSSSGSNSGSDDEHYVSQKPSSRRSHRRPSKAMDVFASPPAPRPPQLNPVHMRSQSMLELQDVTDSTALVTPRDKRMKN
ncbi:hypothetical protein PR202_ga02950 [Eleusine coracana subsp. coracana]|uniref:Uncharacterized protein n=1 Tax=Eleusine coracana subsp. coracana TaxID=191504 RepID=A0AAV5BN59_ELECO|nr:hypothetical protein PR202_ga02950 [Eleusine coracana subsp. coracana]